MEVEKQTAFKNGDLELAGKTAINNRIKHHPATYLIPGNSNNKPNRTSKNPLI